MFAGVPYWLQIIFIVGAIATALTAVIVLLRKLWPALTSFVSTVNALGDLPDFITRTDATLAGQNLKIEEIHHEVHYNNGSSVKDAIGRVETNSSANIKRLARIEKGVAGLYTRVDANEKAATKDRADIAAARQELEDTRPIMRKPAPRRTKKETP